MDGHIDGWDLELLKEDLEHALPMLGWIHIGLSQQDGALIGRNLEQRKRMLPQQFHIVPVIYDSVRDGVFQFVQTSLVGVQLLSDVGLQLVGRVGNDHLILGSAHTELA